MAQTSHGLLMLANADHPPDALLAVFETPDQARRAVRRLSQIVDDPRSIDALPLPPGQYELAAVNSALEAYAALRGAALGAPLGAIAGLGLAMVLLGATPFPVIGGTAAGALAGLLVGGRRAVARSRWTDTGCGVLDVSATSGYVLVTVPARTLADSRARARAIRALGRSGAIAFLEPVTRDDDVAH
jgi:hypothetical protein